MALVSVSICVALGVWQLQRLAWKTDLLATLRARVAAPPVAGTAEDFTPARVAAAGGDGGGYRKIRVDGVFGAERVYVHGVRDGRAGRYVVTPMTLADGGRIFVDLGFEPTATHLSGAAGDGATAADRTATAGGGDGDARRDGADRPAARAATVIGLRRPAEAPGWFTPAPDRSARLWFSRDLADMAAALGPPMVETGAFLQALDDSADAAIATDAGGGGGGAGSGPLRRMNAAAFLAAIPNNHAGYAATWFSFAAIQAIIYLLWRRRRRGRGRGAAPAETPAETKA